MIQKNWQSLIKPQNLEIKDVEGALNAQTFVAGPLERGFAITLGNALRRVLLSSLQGAAITSVQFEGDAHHEFSALAGIIEDVPDVILNLKCVAVSYQGEGPKKVRLKVETPGPVYASQFELPTGVKILNPDQYICTINEGGSLSAEVIITTGRGYVPAEALRQPDTPIGVIPIDAIFSPVRKVSYRVEDTRVGQVTDYDKLILDVETDGSVTPEDAVAIAARILQDQLKLFVNFEEPKADERVSDSSGLPFNRNLLRKIEELELSVRSANCLKNENLIYVGDLVRKTESEMLRTPNFGRKSLLEIRAVLTAMGLELGMHIASWPPENIEEMARQLDEPFR